MTSRAFAQHFPGVGLTSSPEEKEEPSNVGDLSVDLDKGDESGGTQISTPQLIVTSESLMVFSTVSSVLGLCLLPLLAAYSAGEGFPPQFLLVFH